MLVSQNGRTIGSLSCTVVLLALNAPAELSYSVA